MACNNYSIFDKNLGNNENVLSRIRMDVISHSIRGNIFGQFGRFLTEEKKRLLTEEANKIDTQNYIDKLLALKERREKTCKV